MNSPTLTGRQQTYTDNTNSPTLTGRQFEHTLIKSASFTTEVRPSVSSSVPVVAESSH